MEWPWRWHAAVVVPVVCVLVVATTNFESLWQWYQYRGVPHWVILEDRIKRAIRASAQDALPRGWLQRRDVLGRVYFFDLLTLQSSRTRPAKTRPLYEPLQRLHPLSLKRPWEIRVAVIVPSTDIDAPLECMLVKVPFVSFIRQPPLADLNDRDPSFSFSKWLAFLGRRATPLPAIAVPDSKATTLGNVLSYCWGEPGQTETILLNGHCVKITRNLASALRQLRRSAHTEPAMIWIDAICIDQSDMAEKSLAVQDMSNYYQYAHTVHVWLGDTIDADISDRFLQSRLVVQRDRSSPIWTACVNGMRDGTITADDVKDDLVMLKAIATLPYWRRRWVIQEACMAQRLRVYCGNSDVTIGEPSALHLALHYLKMELTIQEALYKTEPQQFHEYCQVFREHHVDSNIVQTRAFEAGTRLWRSRTGPREHLLPHLAEIVSHFGYSLSSDPRDAVYGLLSLFRDIVSVNVDYTQHHLAIYSDFASQLMTVTQSVDLLSQARFRGFDEDSYPSWVPDFSRPSLHGLPLRPEMFGYIVSAMTPPRFEILNSRIIKSAAFDLGKVIEVCKHVEAQHLPHDAQSPHPASLEQTRQRYEMWKKFFDKHDAGGSDHRFQWRMLCIGWNPRLDSAHEYAEGPPSDADYDRCGDEFHVFLNGGNKSSYANRARIAVDEKTLFVTESGHFGLTGAEVDLQAEDSIIALASAKVPFCARRVANEASCDTCQSRLIGQGYLCALCRGGMFAICTQCVSRGRKCDVDDHTLFETRLLNGIPVECRGADGNWVTLCSPAEAQKALAVRYMTLQGCCYLEGVMNGEAINAESCRRFGDESRVDEVFEDIHIV